MSRQTKIAAKSTRKEYYKYFAVLLLLAATATLMSTTVSFHWVDWFRWFAGGFLLLFGSFKLISYDTFLVTFRRYDSMAERYKFYNYIVPIIQVFLGICFILDIAPVLRNLVVLFIAAEGLFSVSGNLMRRGPSAHAVCLPGFLKLPLTTTLLFENVIMTFTIVLMFVAMITA
jgi:hypothetical protein